MSSLGAVTWKRTGRDSYPRPLGSRANALPLSHTRHCQLMTKLHENMTSRLASHLFPCLGAVGLASTVDGALVLTKMYKRDRKTSKVGHVVVQQLSSLIHFVVKTTVGHLQFTLHS